MRVAPRQTTRNQSKFARYRAARDDVRNRPNFSLFPLQFAALLNHQQETALAYYLKNAERLSPKGLFESLSKWRPCSSDNCLYHQYTKSMVSADDLLNMPEVFQQGFGTASGIQVSRDLSGGAGFASMASKAMNIPKASVNQRLDNAVLSLSGRIGTPNQEHTKLTHHTERVASLNQVGNVVPLADVSKSTEESVTSVNQQDDVSASKQRDRSVVLVVFLIFLFYQNCMSVVRYFNIARNSENIFGFKRFFRLTLRRVYAS